MQKIYLCLFERINRNVLVSVCQFQLKGLSPLSWDRPSILCRASWSLKLISCKFISKLLFAYTKQRFAIISEGIFDKKSSTSFSICLGQSTIFIFSKKIWRGFSEKRISAAAWTGVSFLTYFTSWRHLGNFREDYLPTWAQCHHLSNAFKTFDPVHIVSWFPSKN